MSYPDKPSFLIKTLGCKVNQYESEKIKASLVADGFCYSDKNAIADVYIINSCTVTHKADRETRRLIRKFRKENSGALICVAGCYAEKPDDREKLLSIDESVILISNKEKELSSKLIEDSLKGIKPEIPKNEPQHIFGGKDRAFLKIQDGCDNACSYCKVTQVRGKSVSRTLEDIENEFTTILADGFKEIVLTGVCVGSWGRDLSDANGLSTLLERLCRIKGDHRIRISSIEPHYVSKEIIGVVKRNPKICGHFHIPLQSGDDNILRLMNRGYNTQKFKELIAHIKEDIPYASFTTDIIIGFPGEDQTSFEATCKFLNIVKPSRIHVFTYSERKGTKAQEMVQNTTMIEVKRRMRKINELARSLSARYATDFLNRKLHVLVESERDISTGFLTGYTENYIRVIIEASDERKGLQPVKIEKVRNSRVFGRFV